RRGEHPFRSVDIARTAGGPLWRRYGTPVSLEAFEVEIRADLYGEQLVLGVQRTARSLGNRVLRSTALRTALKPTVAAAMLRLVRAHRGAGRLIDPMCGSG
ncbi:MAG: SAM-dependent methyltransferase, partial [Actinobacteria bacterium]|nr:SAM-dependent methyltransferase [Actinomycetota bacterium]